MIRIALQIAFWLALAVWYVLLVRPGFPQTSAELGKLNAVLPYLVQKGLHLGVYAVLGGMAVAVFSRWRWWVLGVVLAHGVLSEVGQYYGNLWFETHRSGDPLDVLIDWTGVAIGCGMWWTGKRFLPSPAKGEGSGISGKQQLASDRV